MCNWAPPNSSFRQKGENNEAGKTIRIQQWVLAASVSAKSDTISAHRNEHQAPDGSLSSTDGRRRNLKLQVVPPADRREC